MKPGVLSACLLLFGMAASASAAEIKGTVRKVDADGQRLTLDVSGASKSYDVAKGASIVRQEVGDKKKPAAIRVIEKGAAGVAVGSTVEFLTEELGGKTVITSLKVTSSPKPAAAAPPKKPPEPKKPKPKPPAKPKPPNKKGVKPKKAAKR